MTTLNNKQLDILAKKIAENIYAMQDELWNVEKLMEKTGLSKSYIYHNAGILGGVKACGKLFFSKRNVEFLIKSGSI